MLKVLRKYNKILLVIGGTLLLVAFLVPQAIQQMGQQRLKRTVAVIDGVKLTAADVQDRQSELVSLEGFFREVKQPMLSFHPNATLEHWILLTREAEDAGLVGGPAEGRLYMTSLADRMVQQYYEYMYREQAAMAMQQDPEQVQVMMQSATEALATARLSAAAQGRFTSEEFDRALARYQGVERLLNRYLRAARVSEPRAMRVAKRLGDEVIADVVLLRGRDLADETATATTGELDEFFNRFRELNPGEGEFQIGYRLPARVKLEWLELSRSVVEGAITVSLLDATKYWNQNRETFKGEFEAERAQVESALRREKTDRVFAAADAVIRGEVSRVVRALVKRGAYRELPADWASQRPSLSAIAEQVVAGVEATEGVKIPLPVVRVETAKWLDERGVQGLPGVGLANLQLGTQRIPFQRAVFLVRELAGESDLGFQVGVPVTDTPAVGFDQSRYYFTVLEAAAPAAPLTRDELLDPEQVVKDWRALRKYEELHTDATKYVGIAVEQGMGALAEGFGDKPSEAPVKEGEDPPAPTPLVRVLENQFFSRPMEGAQPSLSTLLGESVVEGASRLDPLTPIEGVPTVERTLSAPLPPMLSVAVVQVKGLRPVTRELMRLYADEAARIEVMSSFTRGELPKPFSIEALMSRHAVEFKRAESREAVEQSATEAGGADEASGAGAPEGAPSGG